MKFLNFIRLAFVLVIGHFADIMRINYVDWYLERTELH